MSVLVRERCANHTAREAAARCPICGRFFCRECVTEHDGKMTCTACVAATAKSAEERRSSGVLLGAFSIGGFLTAWLIFYYTGMWLARMPDVFHGDAP